MKKLFFVLLFFLPFLGLAQEKESLQDILETLKKQVVIDSADKSIIGILDKLFVEGLQADVPNYSAETLKEFQDVYNDPHLKNMHVMALFMIYQNHITQYAQSGNSDPKYQVEIMELLTHESREIFGKIPVIFYIYQVEAYNSAKNFVEAGRILKEARTIYPNAIPLKVYAYLNTKDDILKNEIIQKHANHWLVKQTKIQD